MNAGGASGLLSATEDVKKTGSILTENLLLRRYFVQVTGSFFPTVSRGSDPLLRNSNLKQDRRVQFSILEFDAFLDTLLDFY